MNKILRGILMLLLTGIFCFSGYKLFTIIAEYQKGTNLYQDIAQQAVVSASSSRPTTSQQSQAAASSKATAAEEPAPFSVDFEALWQQNEDVVGWIYCEDTPISYPVVQAEDNDYYLRRMLDGTRNDNGTIFMDYRNNADMSDLSTFIYGHNMKNDAMFGALPKYSDPKFYEAHPVIWYFTPDKVYGIEPIAAMVVAPDSEIYNWVIENKEEMNEHLELVLSLSDLKTTVDLSTVEQIVTLSTCSYEYDDARYVVIGKLSEAKAE